MKINKYKWVGYMLLNIVLTLTFDIQKTFLTATLIGLIMVLLSVEESEE